MSLLAIDTATEACSVALETDQGQFTRFEVAPREHARLCLPMIESVLEESGTVREEIEWIAFGRGPGAFTGVRVATGIAHGLATGLGVGLYPISTLAAMAARAFAEEGVETVLTCLDARMKEVYWAGFQRNADGLPQPIIPEQVCGPDAVEGPEVGLERSLGVGRGWAAYPEALRKALDQMPGSVEAERFPMAIDMLTLARAQNEAGQGPIPPEQAQPVYLRDQVVQGKVG